jgi:hypothetical protein
MSAHDVTLVDMDVSLPDAPAQAQRVLGWLHAGGIIADGIAAGELHRRWLASLGRDDAPGLTADPRIVYPPGPAVHLAAADDLSGLFRNWLEVDVGRRVFDAGEHGIGVFCPACNADQTGYPDAWGNAISDWHQGGDGLLGCAACGATARLRQWRFDPVWGFGNLGFRFCGWTLRPDFITRMQAAMGHEVRVVHTHI